MLDYICTTCGVQQKPALTKPTNCPICEDDRQYVNPNGQSWTTMEALNQQHKNILELIAPNIYAIYSTPAFAIGQRAHLLCTPQGNILWDCITNLDHSTIELVKELGGIQMIALSHPHYYSTMVAWSKAFGQVPIYVHQRDAEWVQVPDDVIQFWDGPELELMAGIRLICLGGHFPGGTVLHWAEKKALFVGDIIQVSPDLKTVSFMYSYPNLIPLPKKDILSIKEAVKDLDYTAMYGAFGRYIRQKAKSATTFSLERYLKIYD